LVVDDEPSIRKALHTTLSGLGFEIEEAVGGEQAAASTNAVWSPPTNPAVRVTLFGCGLIPVGQAPMRGVGITSPSKAFRRSEANLGTLLLD